MKNILFIGNSFTYFNDMPFSIFKKICDATDISVLVKSITCGGYRLSQFADPENEYGKQVLFELENNSFDIVILQEQSRTPVTNFDIFYSGAEKLVTMAKSKGAEVYLYQTWGYKEGHNLLPECGGSTSVMASKLKEGYCKAAEILNINVCPVGDAFLDVHTNSDIDLYNPDLFHPSLEGSTLAALVLFSSIFKMKTSDITFESPLDENTIKYLKSSADKVKI